MSYWGVDLGGTKIECAVLKSLDPLQTVIRKRIDTQAEQGYEVVLRNIKCLIDSVATEINEKPQRIGIGTPGVIDPKTNLLKNSNAVCLTGKPLEIDLNQILKTTVLTANDANCFALAEAVFGSARGSKTSFGVIMGTGVGGGIVVDGKVLYGAQGIAGEWGHNVLEPQGKQCYCGKIGCVETVISGPAIERYYGALSGKKLKLPEIVQVAKSSTSQDSAEKLAVSRLHQMFGKAISVVINILDPEVIVLGGGVSNIDSLYTEGVEEIKKFVFNSRLDTKIVKNMLGDSAGVFGAAAL